MRFYLGTHHPHWLRSVGEPLFVSRRQLTGYRTPPRALGPWALDSGGFTELSMHGKWVTSESDYIEDVEWLEREVGNLEWIAPQDWMCEPWIVEKTGLSVSEHQARTVESYLRLRARTPLVVPVLQGWTRAEYQTCAELYEANGVNLAALPLVAIGSVCRRQQTQGGREVVQDFYRAGLKLHAFGMKLDGLREVGWMLESSDSLAWSYAARRAPGPMIEGHTHQKCNNCLPWALKWRERVENVFRVQQPDLGLVVA